MNGGKHEQRLCLIQMEETSNSHSTFRFLILAPRAEGKNRVCANAASSAERRGSRDARLMTKQVDS